MAKFEQVEVVEQKREEASLQWYEFGQNNSGGSFYVDDRVTHRVYIQAFSNKEAVDKAESLGIYFDGCSTGNDCSCCGDRWSEPWSPVKFPIDWGKKKKFNTIEEYVSHMVDEYAWCSPDAYLYYYDGTKSAVYSEKYPKKEG